MMQKHGGFPQPAEEGRHARGTACSDHRLLFLVGALTALISVSRAETQVDPGLPRYSPVAGLSGSIHSVGSNKMDELTFRWILLFRRYYPAVRPTMEARGLYTAAPALLSGAADVAPTGFWRLSPAEEGAFRQKFGYPPLGIRICGGSFDDNDGSEAIAVFVNESNPVSGLSLAQVGRVFLAGRHSEGLAAPRTWGDLGVGGPWAARPITPICGKLPNPLANAFRDIAMPDGEFRSRVHEEAGASDTAARSAVVRAVAADPGAIGIAGFGQAARGARALPLCESGGGPYVRGSFETVRNHSYPLSRFGYAYVNKPPGQPLPPALREFILLILSREGQQVAAEEGPARPLTASVVIEERKKIE